MTVGETSLSRQLSREDGAIRVIPAKKPQFYSAAKPLPKPRSSGIGPEHRRVHLRLSLVLGLVLKPFAVSAGGGPAQRGLLVLGRPVLGIETDELKGVLQRQVRQLAGGIFSGQRARRSIARREANVGMSLWVTNVCSHASSRPLDLYLPVGETRPRPY
jgi:hypothetical protein